MGTTRTVAATEKRLTAVGPVTVDGLSASVVVPSPTWPMTAAISPR